ncbi:LLM class flavin-dependent oxidoreductase [Streptomyces sp. NPDC021098]|uniref:LLM class flavin-dependent oxidoreductase n=1 Tax=Streptomyces sp. NPDC021098 TaxID=3365113 RepID=UPI0037B9FEB2
MEPFLCAARPSSHGTQSSGDDTDSEGETLASRPVGPTAVPGASPAIPVLVAAMEPRALAAAGELADGTIPFLAGPRTLAERIVPAITEAAAAAGRPAPQIVAGVPAVVTDDAAAARDRVSAVLGFYDSIPSYRKAIATEGLSHAADLLIAGDEDTVTAGLRRYLDAGATEVMLTHTDLFDTEDRARTWSIAQRL